MSNANSLPIVNMKQNAGILLGIIAFIVIIAISVSGTYV